MAGRPWRVTVKEGASDGRALHANRCSQERRQCARWARVKTFSGSVVTDKGWVELSRQTVSLRTTLSHPRRMRQRGQSFQSTGARDDGGGASRCVGEEGERGGERPQYRTYPPRLAAFRAFLTLCPQGTAATMADTSGIQEPQGAITLGAPFLWIERAISGATQRPIRLRGKSRPWKASRKRRPCEFRGPVRHRGSGLRDRCRLDDRLRFDDPGCGEFRRAQF